ncbi:PHP domain-containing protein [Gorillibacterium sp. sgz5001074]|uniref:PHP domain-containing protein n=1 Tax=Gorillibacterium sp. sgz5001074 TaxID=3446695 RepID=UPI003F66F459
MLREADLHTHTIASDGTETPADNVRTALAAGLFAVAITDHDTVSGIGEALEEGKRVGITVVPGVEISTVAAGRDIHVLGYYLRWEDPLLLERLAELRAVRDRRNDLMLEKLRELGIAITMDEVLALRNSRGKPDETVGRPHIAEVLMHKGVVRSLREAFDRYLGSGGAAYVNPPRIRPETAITWIHEAGGAAVLAHPGIYGDDALVDELLDGAGWDGVEAYHSDHTPEQCERYRSMAESRGLIVTAGSDYHGQRGGVVFHAPLGSQRAPAEVLKQLEHAAERYQNMEQIEE